MKSLMHKPLLKKSAFIALEIVIILLVIFGVRAWQQQDLPTGQAPGLQGQLISGEDFRLKTQKNRPILVHFWATWCPVCRLELDTIHSLARDYNVITVAMQSGNADTVRAYLAKHNVGFPVLNDSNYALSRQWQIKGVPTSFVVNREGEIQSIEVGYTSEIGFRARFWWAQ